MTTGPNALCCDDTALAAAVRAAGRARVGGGAHRP